MTQEYYALLCLQIIDPVVLVFSAVFEMIKTSYCAFSAFYNQIHKPGNLKNLKNISKEINPLVAES
jgi:hypothetical protein